MCGSFSRLLMPESNATSKSPSRPCKIGRCGSRSKRSTSTRPRSLVAISTGIRRARARSRRMAFMSNESHSSTTMSSPSRNSSTVSTVSPTSRTRTQEVWVELGDPAGSHLGLVQPEVQYGRRHPVEIGKLNAIEIRQPKLAAQALRGQGVRDDMPDAQTDDTDAQRAEPGLLLGGDHVPVAVQPDRSKRPRSQHRHNGPPPGVIRPPAGFGNQLRIGWRPKPAQFLELFLAMVDEFDDGIGAQLLQYRIVCGVCGVENLSGAGSYGHLLGAQPRRRMRAQIGPPAIIVNGAANENSSSSEYSSACRINVARRGAQGGCLTAGGRCGLMTADAHRWIESATPLMTTRPALPSRPPTTVLRGITRRAPALRTDHRLPNRPQPVAGRHAN